jgi:hypothetical protein
MNYEFSALLYSARHALPLHAKHEQRAKSFWLRRAIQAGRLVFSRDTGRVYAEQETALSYKTASGSVESET